MSLTIKKKSKGKDIDRQFKIDYRNPKELIPYPKNAKVHSDSQITELSESIGQFDFDVPVVVDGDGVIIKGHGRQLAAIEAGKETIPVIERKDLTPEQVKAARLADNKLGESPWDMGLLGEELRELKELEFMDADFTSLGFDEHELEAILAPESLEDLEAQYDATEPHDFLPTLKIKCHQQDKDFFEGMLGQYSGEHDWDRFSALVSFFKQQTSSHGSVLELEDEI